ncbi:MULTISPECIES: sensor histidine kinase [unclassified Geodermatophilus]|uniref:sensor histidine kinase n=1 Tax=unclassified Geodermatophilus TaxID=2637632 RepID=UPI003EEF37E8
MAAPESARTEQVPAGETAPPVRLAGPGAPGGPRRAGGAPPTARRVLARFVAGNLLAAAVLLASSVWASHVAARNESLADARSRTDLLAALLIEPNLDDALLAGDTRAAARLDAVVEGQLRDASVVRIKIWDESERIVYSDEDQLMGRSFPAGEYQVDTLAGMSAEVSDLGSAENVFERSEGRLLEVYRPITTPSGERLVLEVYFSHDQVTSRQRTIWLNIAPISAAALGLLTLLQVPLARRMIRDVRAADRERLRLHARAAEATAEERRRIAGNLHDGVVQELSAAPLIMSRALQRLERQPGEAADDEALATDLRSATDAVRQSVASLRSLLIEIYPPHLAQAGLPAALGDLTARVRSRGVDTRLHLPDDLDVPPETAALLFRVAQEALLNVVRHARAGTAVVTVVDTAGSVTLEVRDDGVGFDPAEASAPTGTGHFGLRVLSDLAEQAGATLELTTAPGRGTSLRLVVPR